MRWWRVAAAALIGLAVGAVLRHETSGDDAFRLARPTPTTIRALGLVRPPDARTYVGGWCQAPCATYSVRGTVVSVTRGTWYPGYGYVVVLRDGGVTIAGRIQQRPVARAGDRVEVSGVLFFPTPPGRDGGSLPTGAELSPIYALQLLPA